MSKLYTNEELANIETAITEYSIAVLTQEAHDAWEVVIKTLIEQARAYNLKIKKSRNNQWKPVVCDGVVMGVVNEPY